MSTARRRDRVRNRSRDVLGAGRTRGVSRGRLEGADEALRRRLLFVLPGRRGLYRPGDRIAPAALRYPAAHSDYRGRRWNRDELVGRLALRRRADHRRRRSRAAQNRARDTRTRRAITDLPYTASIKQARLCYAKSILGKREGDRHGSFVRDRRAAYRWAGIRADAEFDGRVRSGAGALARWKSRSRRPLPRSADAMRGPASNTFAGCSRMARFSSAWCSIRRLSKSPRRCWVTT